jgi:hypothetical protein
LLGGLEPVLFVREMRRVVYRRDDPWELSRLKGSAEGYLGGLLVNSAGLWFAVGLTTVAPPPGGIRALLMAGAMTGILWYPANIAVAATILAVLARSRILQRDAWEQLDFIAEHAPRNGRPPETIEEYRAQRLKAQQ